VPIRAREAELEGISGQTELERRAVPTAHASGSQRAMWPRRAGEADGSREKLTEEELAAVNEQAMPISDEVQGGWSRAVVA